MCKSTNTNLTFTAARKSSGDKTIIGRISCIVFRDKPIYRMPFESSMPTFGDMNPIELFIGDMRIFR